MNKSITIFTEVYYPEDFRINEFVQFLSDNNFSLNVVTRVPSYPKGKLKPGFSNKFQKEICNNTTIYRYPIFLNYDVKKINKILNLIWQPIALALLYYRLKPSNIFIFQTGSIYQYIFLPIFTRVNTRVIIWSQDLWPEAGYVLAKRLKVFDKPLRYLTNSILKSCQTVLVQSEGFANHYLNVYGLHCAVVPNFSPVKFNVKKRKTNGNLLYAGNIGSAQNLDELIQLYKYFIHSVPDYFSRFDIYGDGSELSHLRHKYRNTKEIIFHGRVKRQELDIKVMSAKFVCFSLKNELNYTIPGRFQYFYNLGANILYLGSGEVKTQIENTNCGIVAYSKNDPTLKRKLLEFDYLKSSQRPDQFDQNETLFTLLYYVKKTFNF